MFNKKFKKIIAWFLFAIILLVNFNVLSVQATDPTQLPTCANGGTLMTDCVFNTNTIINSNLIINTGVKVILDGSSLINFEGSNLTINTGGTLFIASSTLFIASTTANSLINNGEIMVAREGVLSIASNATLTNNDRLNINGALINNGVIDYNGSGVGIANCNAMYGGNITGSGTISDSQTPICANASANNANIVFTNPANNMTNLATSSISRIFFAFDRPMNSTSIIDTDASDTNSNVWLTSDFGTTKLAGAVHYYSDSNTCNTGESITTCPSSMNNIGVFIPDNLNSATTYELRIEPNVLDLNGSPVNTNYGLPYYSLTFATDGNICTTNCGTAVNGGYGAFTPPFVIGTMPTPGSFNLPINTLLSVKFSKPINASTLNSSNLKIFTVSDNRADGSEITGTTITPNQENDSVKISASFSANTKYRLKVYGNITGQDGVKMDSSNANNVMWTSDFETGANSDSGQPIINFSYPSNGETNISTTPGSLNLYANKALDPETINNTSIYLKTQTNNIPVAGEVKYDSFSKMISFIPSVALATSTAYLLTASSSIKDFVSPGNYLISTSTLFTTGALNNKTPETISAIADDYKIEVNFNIPMNTVPNGTNSVLNKTNLTITQGATVASATSPVNLNNAFLKYDAQLNKLVIQGVSLTIGNYFKVIINPVVKGLNEVNISNSNNEATGPITAPVMQNAFGVSTTVATSGAIGTAGTNTANSFIPTNFDSTTFGFVPQANVNPFNMMAGQTTIYHINLPISKQIEDGGKIVLTFPLGFDVSGAKQDVNSPMNSDFNGPSTGTPKFGQAVETSGGGNNDGITVDTTARTITITLSGATNSGGNDFLNFDIAGIVNSSIPKDWTTDGYKIDVKTKNTANTVLETISTMPFFIQAGGSNSLTLTLDLGAGNGGADTVKVYLDSPMTGPLEKISDAFGGDANATINFTNLPTGDYRLFTDSSLTINTIVYKGINPPLNIRVSGATAKTINLTGESVGATDVTINISGPINEPLDVFAGSKDNFKVQQITLDGSGSGTASLKLTNGEWFIGVGPQMPKGISTGAMPQPNYIIPKSKNIIVNNPACTINGITSNNCGTPVSFALTSADKELKGTVKDNSGRILSNVDVWANDSINGFGTFARTDTNGQFTLKLKEGKFKIGASIPGMSQSKENLVEIIGTNYKVDGGASQALPTNFTSFILKLVKPDYTISGTVSDATGNVIAGASISARLSNGLDFVNAPTGNDGKYTLYVKNGTWKINAYLPGYGPLPEETIIISDAGQSGVNFSPSNSGDTYHSVSGTVAVDGSNLANAFVHLESTAKINNQFRFADAITGDDGSYSVKVPAGTYKILAMHPTYGEFIPLSGVVISADTSGKNFSKTAPREITVNFTDSSDTAKIISEAFIDFFNSTSNFGNFLPIKNSSSGTIKLPDGNYTVRVNIPGLNPENLTLTGTGDSVTNNILTVNGNETITIKLASLKTISGTVSANNTPVQDVWVEISDATNGMHIGGLTNSSGVYSLEVPNGSYKIIAMKPGYSGARQSLTVSANTTQNLTLTSSSLTISGRITAGSATSSHAFVRAEKIGDNAVVGIQADIDGNYSLPVSSGSWNLYAVANGYTEKMYDANNDNVGDTLEISSSVSNKNINLTQAITLQNPVSQPIIPSQGGTVSAPDMKVKLTIPANALGSNNSSGNLSVTETSNIIRTSTAAPFGLGREISATDSNGQEIKNFNDSITLEMEYSKSELDSAFTNLGITSPTIDDVNNLNLSYWDETAGSWINRPSTITITPSDASTYADITSIKIKGSTTHFTVFAIIMPFTATISSTVVASAPTPSSSGGGGGGILYPLAQTKTVTTEESKPASTSEKTKTLSDTAVTNLKTTASKVINKLETILSEAGHLAKNNLSTVLEKLGLKKNALAEESIKKTYLISLTKGVKVSSEDQVKLNNFITYGTQTTKVLGEGERAGVLNSYKTAFGKLPASQTDWEDTVKIANGRWPNERNSKVEIKAEKTFKEIYKREPNRKNPNDDAAVTIASYGLRVGTRNLNSEKAAIKSFKNIYGYAPVGASDWDTVRAIAYSGAKR